MIDARIPLMAQPMPLEPPSNALARVLALQNAQQHNALNGMQMQDMQAQRQAQEAQRQQMGQFIAGLPDPPDDAPEPLRLYVRGVKSGAVPFDMKTLQGLIQSPEEKPLALNPGQTVYRRGQAEYTAPPEAPKPEKAPEIIRLVEARDALPPGDPRRAALDAYITKMTTHAPAASNVTYAAPVPFQMPDGSIGYAQPGNRAGAQPMVMTGPDGKPLQKPPEASKDHLTEGQAKATALLGQMRSASGELEKLGGAASTLSQQAEVALAGGPANIAISAKAQQINQARMQWAEAFLRFKTGAASTPAEVKANVETFFPKIGDKPEVIDQKARMRAQAEKDMVIAAGKGADKLAPQAEAGPVKVNSIADAQKLAPGTVFIDPNGVRRVR